MRVEYSLWREVREKSDAHRAGTIFFDRQRTMPLCYRFSTLMLMLQRYFPCILLSNFSPFQAAGLVRKP